MSGSENSHNIVEPDSQSDVSEWFNLVLNEANLSKVKNLLAKCFRINIKNGSGNTGQHIAAFKGLERLAKLLINRGADFNSKNRHGDTPLAMAAMNGHYKCVKLFIEHRANVNYINNYEVSPLMSAAKNGHTNIVKLLIKHKALVNLCGKHGAAIHFATMEKQVEVVKLLLKNKTDVNLMTQRRWTALNIAADVGNVEISNLLLAIPGIDIDRVNEFAVSPLLTAAFRGSKNILESLLRLTSHLQIDIYGHSALMLACLASL